MAEGSVEQLLVKIGADVGDLKKGLSDGAKATKDFKGSVNTVTQELKSFKGQAVGAIQGLGGVENAFDALTGSGKLTAGTVGQLTGLLPLLTTPAGAATVAIGALGVGVMKVVEAERKLKENKTAALLKEVKEAAEAASKGWDAYFKSLEAGGLGAKNLRELATTGATIDQNRKRFEENTAALEAQNVKLREANTVLEKDIQAWKESGKTHGFFGKTLEQSERALAANLATIKANEATIRQGYTPALEELAEKKAKVAKATKELTDAQTLENEQAEELIDMYAELGEVMSGLMATEDERMAKHVPFHAQEIKQTKEELRLYNEMAGASGDAFASIVTGAESAEDAMRDLIKQIVAAILKMLILRALQTVGGPEAAFLGPVVGGLVGVASGASSTGSTSSGMSSSGTSVVINESPFIPRSAADMAKLVRVHLRDALEDNILTGELRTARGRR